MKEILFVLILVLANVIQAITGFSGGPIAIASSMALVGVMEAKASITLIFWGVSILMIIQNFKDIDFKVLFKIIVFMVIGMIPGMWLFDRLPTTLLMIIYGSFVVGIGAKKLYSSIKNPEGPRDEIKAPWNYIALFLAGIMQGMFTSGGPFMAIYATSALKEKKHFRATVASIWGILNAYMAFNMYRQGMYTDYVVRITLMAAIPVVIAIFVGNKISKMIPQETFLKLVYILLMISGGILLFSAFN